MVTASPSSGGSSLTGSGGSLSYGLYIDSGFTSRWGNGAAQYLSFTGGATAQNNSSLNVYFSKGFSLSGHVTLAQIQAADPSFNPNIFYYYRYIASNDRTYIDYNYLGQGTSAGTG